jgi:hypothetical protein
MPHSIILFQKRLYQTRLVLTFNIVRVADMKVSNFQIHVPLYITGTLTVSHAAGN